MKIWFAFDTSSHTTWQFCQRTDDGSVIVVDTMVDILRPFYWKATAGIVRMVYGKTELKFQVDVPDTPDDIHVAAPTDIEAWQTPEWGTNSSSGNPNDVQVGGDHYKGVNFQPWDWPRHGLGYYEVSAIAYLARFRKKGGIQDLQKVQHYIDKMLFCWREGEYENRCTANLLLIRQFNKDNSCDRFQSEAVQFLVMWRDGDELEEAKKIVEELIQRERDDQCLNDAINNPRPPSETLKAAFARYKTNGTERLVLSSTHAFVREKDIPALQAEQPPVTPPDQSPLGLVTDSGTGVVEPKVEQPPLVFDVATAPLPPYKPLKSALKIPKVWNEDDNPDKLVKHE